ncbi:putative caffeate O-methyltransferase [Helianthus anomalus]
MYDNTRIVMKMILEKYKGFEGSKSVEHVGGDMFQSVSKGDVIFMKLLKNCWAALPDCGRVVLVEAIIPDQESDSSCSDEVGKTVIGGDMIMLIANSSGKERTAKEYNVLAKEAGFTSMEIVCRVSLFWIMESIYDKKRS